MKKSGNGHGYDIYYQRMRFVLAGLGSFALIVAIAHALAPQLYSEYRQPRTMTLEGIVREHDLERNVLVVDTGPAHPGTSFSRVRIPYDDTTLWISAVQEIRDGIFVSEEKTNSSEQYLVDQLIQTTLNISDLGLKAQHITIVTATHL